MILRKSEMPCAYYDIYNPQDIFYAKNYTLGPELNLHEQFVRNEELTIYIKVSKRQVVLFDVSKILFSRTAEYSQ